MNGSASAKGILKYTDPENRFFFFLIVLLRLFPLKKGKPLSLFRFSTREHVTRQNSADSVPTSNLVCIKEVVIRTTFCIAGINYCTCNLVIGIHCTPYKNAFYKRF